MPSVSRDRPMAEHAQLQADGIWERHRRWKIRALRVVLALAAGLAAAAFVGVAVRLMPATALARVPGLLVVLLPFIGGWLTPLLGGADTVKAVIGANMMLATALIFGGLVLWRGRHSAENLHERLFASFNTDVLSRFPPLQPFDPLWQVPVREGETAMGWRDSAAGPRREAWRRLLELTDIAPYDGTRPFFAPPAPGAFTRFRWALISGRPGQGKTRMAVELATRLARAAEWQKAGWRHRAREWLRRAWPTALREPDDPWDSGWLLATEFGGAARPVHGGRTDPADSSYLARLGRWRPRRPTILLLDDPYDAGAGSVVAALRDAQDAYLFPVRLIVVSQSLHSSLGLGYADGRWISPQRGFAGMISLEDDAGFDAADIRVLAVGLGLPARYWRNTDAEVDRIRALTDGNALLVELALQRVRAGHKPEEITREGLLHDRAVRVTEALTAQGFGDAPRLRALAAATLAGGNLPEDRRVAVLKHFGLDAGAFPPDKVARVFSLDPARAVRALLPGIRPNRIGDAFALYVAEDRRLAGDTGEIVRAAWAARPGGVLAALGRLGTGSGALAAELGKGPPDDAGLDPRDVALAYVEAAIRVAYSAWKIQDYGDGKAMLAQARTRLAALEPAHAADAFERIVALMQVDNAVAIVRGGAAFDCAAIALERALRDDTVWSDAPEPARRALLGLFEQIERWGCAKRERGTDEVLFARAARRLLPRRVFQPEAEGYGAVRDMLGASSEVPHAASGALTALAAEAAGVPDGGDIATWLLSAARACRRESLTALPDVPPDGGPTRLSARMRALAWTNAAFGLMHDPAMCAEAVAIVDQIANAGFAADPAFIRVRALARIYWCYGVRSYPAQAELIACDLEALLLPGLADDGGAMFNLVDAWGHVAGFWGADAVRAKAAFDHLVGLRSAIRAMDRGTERRFVTAAADLTVSLGTARDAAGCRLAVDHLRSLGLRRFAGERPFELAYATSLTNLARCLDTNGPACEAMAREVEAVCWPWFAGEADSDYFVAMAWRAVVIAHDADHDSSAAALDKVRRIVRERYAGQPRFEAVLADAYTNAAWVRRHDAPGCLAAAEEAERIVRTYLEDDHNARLIRAQAWHQVAFAFRDDPEARRKAIANIEACLQPPYAEDPELNEWLVKARSFRPAP